MHRNFIRIFKIFCAHEKNLKIVTNFIGQFLINDLHKTKKINNILSSLGKPCQTTTTFTLSHLVRDKLFFKKKIQSCQQQ